MAVKPSYEELEARIRQLEAQSNRCVETEAALKKSLRFTESLLEAIPTPVFYKDVQGRYLGCNQAFTKLFGVTAGQIRGKTVQELWPESMAAVYHQKDIELMHHPTHQVYEHEVKDKDNNTRPVIFSKNPFYDEQGQLAGLVGGFTDIRQLRQAERELQTLFSMSIDLLCIADIHKETFIKINPAFMETLGFSEEELLGRPFTEFIHPDDIATTRQVIKDYLRKGDRVINFKNRYRCKDGTYRSFNWVAHTFSDTGLTYAVVHDTTEENRTTETLRSQRDLLNSMFDNLLLGITVWDAHGRLLMVNKGFAELTGYTTEEIKTLDDWFPRAYPDPEYRAQVLADWNSSKKTTDAVRQFKVTCKTGKVKDIEFRGSFLPDGRALVTLADITEREQAEEALKESEGRFRTLVEESPLGIAVIGQDGGFRYLNRQFRAIFGYTLEDVPNGSVWSRKAYPEKAYRDQVIGTWLEDQKMAPVGQSRERRFNVTCKDGTRKCILFRPVLLENMDQFVICEDLTEKMKLERQFQQAQKFEAIGTLAGGIAHDFNNLLMGIHGRTSLMKVDLSPTHPYMEHLEAVEEYVRSAASLTRQLLGFARGGKYEVKPTDVNELVVESAAMFGRTKKEIRIHTKVHPEPLVADVDRGQIEQVLLNIFVNAWQAMPEGGNLYLETRPVMLDDDHCTTSQAIAGPYAMVSITDTGVGMDEETRRRIFDPFFTTKEKGRGTGLGLASAYGIIGNHGGLITANSEKGSGATFDICLPLSGRRLNSEMPMSGRLVKGSETILLVDDEDMILAVGRAMLEKLGYRVVTACDGRQAVESVARMADEIDLVILDLIMPGMDGGKTFDRIREIRPRTRVLLSSGYAINGQAEEILKRGCNGFIQKPFDIQQLSDKVRQLLG